MLELFAIIGVGVSVWTLKGVIEDLCGV